MGMYTEIFVNVDFKKEIPDDVIETVKAMCDKDHDSPYLIGKPKRWAYLFNNGSYYTPNTECAKLTKDPHFGEFSLLAKGDIKNYDSEIEKFFEFIKPHCEGDFLGYYRYEECREPTLVFKYDERPL